MDRPVVVCEKETPKGVQSANTQLRSIDRRLLRSRCNLTGSINLVLWSLRLQRCRGVSSFGRLAFGGGALEGWRVGLYLSHCLAVVDLLSAVWTFVVFELGHCVFVTLELPGQVSSNTLDPLAATSRTGCYVQFGHRHIALWDDTKNSSYVLLLLRQAFIVVRALSIRFDHPVTHIKSCWL